MQKLKKLIGSLAATALVAMFAPAIATSTPRDQAKMQTDWPLTHVLQTDQTVIAGGVLAFELMGDKTATSGAMLLEPATVALKPFTDDKGGGGTGHKTAIAAPPLLTKAGYLPTMTSVYGNSSSAAWRTTTAIGGGSSNSRAGFAWGTSSS